LHRKKGKTGQVINKVGGGTYGQPKSAAADTILKLFNFCLTR
jgi:hypothetical protein